MRIEESITPMNLSINPILVHSRGRGQEREMTSTTVKNSDDVTNSHIGHAN